MNGQWPEARALQSGRRQRAGLWFGLLGGACAWLVHLLGAYATAEFGCVSSLHKWQWLGISVVAWLCIALTAVTEAVAIVAIFVAYASGPREQDAEDVHAEARRYTAMLGAALSALFALAILFQSVPILYYLRDC